MAEPLTVQTNPSIPQPKSRRAKRLLQTGSFYAYWIGALFLAAGRWDWIRGWISVGLTVLGMTIVGGIVRHYNAPLLEARSKFRRKDTKPFDKIFLAIYLPIVFIHPVVGGLDAVRYHWSSMSFASVYVGAILFTLAMILIAWVMVINPFAETSVRIQTDRGHTVVTTGPYRVVRHPMYLGAILMYASTSLVWGSVWALVLAAVMAALMTWRTSREDQTLRQELAGYDEYTSRTRYRLLPGLW